MADAIAALSFANLLFFRAWHTLLYLVELHFSARDPRPDVLALFANVLALAAMLWLLLWAARRAPSPRVRSVALWMMVLAAILVGRPLAWDLYLASRYGPVAPLLLVVLPLAAATFLRRRLLTIGRAALLCAAPFVLATFGQAAPLLLPAKEYQRPAVLPTAPGQPRVLWLILDEFDYRIAFEQRPSSLRLPEFDRLRSESLSATQAHAPADLTTLSIPALISGRKVAQAKYTPARDMRLTFAGDDSEVSWSRQPNVFSRARELGFNSAVQGWYFPYCWLFRQSLVSCGWSAATTAQEEHESVSTMGESARSQWSLLARHALRLGEITLLPQPRRELAALDPQQQRVLLAQARQQADLFRREGHLELIAAAHRAAADPAWGLVYLHLGLPHLPGMFDRRTGTIAGHGGYLDNLALADQTFGALRVSMEQSGTWASTTVIVSSDHGFRLRMWQREMSDEDKETFAGREDLRVPFILRFPGEQAPVLYQRGFNTVATAELILDVLRGKVATPQQAASWLDARAAP